MTDLTQLLADWRNGEDGAFDQVWHQAYDHLRRIAHRQLGGERAGHTLDTGALVHEAFFKLAGQTDAAFRDRSHFLAVAALAMRRILISHARSRAAQKRGGNAAAVTLDDARHGRDSDLEELLIVDRLLERLAELDARQNKVVVYRFYGGLTDAEIAEALAVSVPTVRRDWRAARAWLARELERERTTAR